MNRIIWLQRMAGSTCGVLLLALVASVAAQTPQDVARIGFASSVTVFVLDGRGQITGNGSGFTVAPGQVLTNEHVVRGAERIVLRRVGVDEFLTVTAVLLRDVRADLALLEVRADTGPPLGLRIEQPEVGETVFVVGSPQGLEGTFSQGIVSSYRLHEDVGLVQITAPISPGSSGGPVLDIAGRVVGVTVATHRDGQNLNFAIPASEVERFLGRPHLPSVARGARSPSTEVGVDEEVRPSFDCDLATTWAERAICSSAILANLDVELNDVYRLVRDRLPDDDFEIVRLRQREWLSERESCEARAERVDRVSCLERLIAVRIEELRQRVQ